MMVILVRIGALLLAFFKVGQSIHLNLESENQQGSNKAGITIFNEPF